MITFTTPYNFPCRLKVARYYDNNNLALILVANIPQGYANLHPDCDGEELMTVSTNVVKLPPDCVAIKDYSENEGIVPILIKAGVLIGEPISYLNSGFVRIPVYKVSPAVLALEDNPSI